MSKKSWNYSVLTFLILLCGINAYVYSFSLEYPIRLNLSSSLPKTFYSAISQPPPFNKGQIVSINHPHLQAVVGKIILGKGGDIISIHSGTFFLNENPIGKVKQTSSTGKRYHPISEGVISEGSYFVYTPHPESFDSRYEEFGLVKEEWITEVLCPLF